MPLLVGATFSGDDMDLVAQALDLWCTEKRIDLRSEEARFAASTAIDLYQAGHCELDTLLKALRATEKRINLGTQTRL